MYMRTCQSYYEFGMNTVIHFLKSMTEVERDICIGFLQNEHIFDDQLASNLHNPGPEVMPEFIAKVCAKLTTSGRFDERVSFITGVNVRILPQHLPEEKGSPFPTTRGPEIMMQIAEALGQLEFEEQHIEALYSIRCVDDFFTWSHLLYNNFLKRSRSEMKLIDSKIFLSHKSADKTRVREYSNTLKSLGFEVWLDEDAMRAGVELERSLLNGFSESCAAVFFVTPNYVDESFLRTEVNYAIAEKRKKGDRFSLITLALNDGNGNVKIPDLLEPYVWKEPQSDLVGIQEIVKALPIGIVRHDWKWG